MQYKKMCPTCNHSTYSILPNSNGNLPPKRYAKLGEGNLCIVYDPIAPLNRYKICDLSERKSDFFIYFCPTCGRRLPS